MKREIMRRISLCFAATAMVLLGLSSLAKAVPDNNDYVFTNGFSSAQGANQWFYMQYDGTQYTNMNWDGAHQRWQGSLQNALIGNGWAHPDVGRDSVIAWQAPKTGTISVRGMMDDRADPTVYPSAQGVQTWVRRRSGSTISQVWPQSAGPQVIPADFAVQQIFTTTVNAGDMLYFHLNVGAGGATYDTTYWNPDISYTFQPKFLLDQATIVMNPADYQAAGITSAQDTSLSTVLNPDGQHLDFYHSEGKTIDPTHHDTTEQKFNGTLLHPFQASNYTASQSAVFTNPQSLGGNWWFSNIYKQDNGNLLAFCHVEEDTGLGGPWKIGLAYSTNNGITFAKLGFIMSQSKPDIGNPPQQNVNGVPYVIRGGYIYAYFSDTGSTGMIPAVARAPLSDVLTASQSGTVTAWKKYYQGAWNENGLGGNATSVMPFSSLNDYSTHGDAAYSTYLNKNILVGFTQGGGTGKGIYITFADDENNYEAPTWLKISTRNNDDSLSPYETIVNADGTDNGQVGQQFYVYYNYRHRANDNANYRWLVRQEVTLNAAAFTKNVYDSGADFSRTNDENSWEYYDFNPTTGVYTPMHWAGDENVDVNGIQTYNNNIWDGATPFSLIGANWQHPDNTNSVRRWVASRSGTVTITSATGDISVAAGGDGVGFTIKKNTMNIWPSTGSLLVPAGASNTFTPITASANKGDIIDFTVDNGGHNNYGYDTASWQPVITYQ